jgi:ABC-type nitrate/sulfonate/bicarbonate transport system substrate-binding protein
VAARDSGSQISSVLTGQVAAFVGEADLLANQIKAGKVRLLVDATSTQGRAVIPSDIVGPVFWGLKANITAKRAAVTGFVAALKRADIWIHSATADQIVQALSASSLVKGTSASDLALQVPYDIPLYSPTNGFISEAAWQQSLAAYKTIGIEGVDVTSPQFSYANFVNMSFWNAAS